MARDSRFFRTGETRWDARSKLSACSYYANDYLFLFGKERQQQTADVFHVRKSKKFAARRKSFGLPKQGVIFANFNNLYKILRLAPNSSLALLSLPEDAVENLRREFSSSHTSLS
eukprot:762016-Hanusia_phi.AAC.1